MDTPITPETPWIIVAEGAAYARTSNKTIFRACEDGGPRHARVGGRRAIRLRKEWIDDWLLRTTTPIEVTRR